MSEIGDALRRELSTDRVLDDAAALEAHRLDYWILAHLRARQGRLGADPACVVRPRSTAEVATAVRTAQRHKVAVVAYGGGSGVLGGAVPPADPWSSTCVRWTGCSRSTRPRCWPGPRRG